MSGSKTTHRRLTFRDLSKLVQEGVAGDKARQFISLFRRAVESGEIEATYGTGRFTVPGDSRKAREMIYAETPDFQAWLANTIEDMQGPEPQAQRAIIYLCHAPREVQQMLEERRQQDQDPRWQALLSLKVAELAELTEKLSAVSSGRRPHADEVQFKALLGEPITAFRQPSEVTADLCAKYLSLINQVLLSPSYQTPSTIAQKAQTLLQHTLSEHKLRKGG